MRLSGIDAGSLSFAELRLRVHGEVVVPEDCGWAEACAVWNTHVIVDPFAVVYVLSAHDVQAVVRFAGQHGLAVSVVANGHGATSALSGTILIKTERMTEVHVDTERRVARVDAGAKWCQLTEALEGTGLMGLPGSTPDVTVVGYLLGGGLSWLGRKYGFAADYMRSCEVVTGEAELVTVTEDCGADLFWGLCGGGGDLGVVTAVEIALIEAESLYGGELMWPAEHTAEVLAAFAQETVGAPRELSMWLWLTTFPPFDPIPPERQGRSFANLNVVYLGPPEEAEDLLHGMRAVPGLEVDTLRELTASQLGEVSGEPTTPMPAMDWSRTAPALTDGFQWQLLKLNWPSAQTPTVVCIRHLGGAFGDHTRGAVPLIDNDYLVLGFGLPFHKDQQQVIDDHFARLESELAEELSRVSTYNMLGQQTDVSDVFDAGTRQRLSMVKGRTDPARTIRSNRPLE